MSAFLYLYAGKSVVHFVIVNPYGTRLEHVSTPLQEENYLAQLLHTPTRLTLRSKVPSSVDARDFSGIFIYKYLPCCSL